ncbi:hypothetical protein [Streptosporangium nondiastaticum]|uniref:hypothetical protein n=1 Tax=Streptosporangium nondiastaticum TaxID=35764 RepID=UPI0011B29D86|nr:hypothetical protein [Streptosporangium nondiastaticum]
MSWWSKSLRDEAKSWYFSPIPPERTPTLAEQRSITPESGYLNAFLASMRIANARVATRTYYGTVTSSFVVSTRGSGQSEFIVVTTPQALKDLDSKHLGRVVTINKRLLGPLPYRGGDIDIEIGLFGMQAADLLEPYLEVVEKISDLAGVGLVATGVPLVPTIKLALNGLLGSNDSPKLELGLVTTFDSPQTGYYCAVRADRDDQFMADIGIGKDGRLIHANGNEVKEPYLVFNLEYTERRDDWAQIPGLAASYEDVKRACLRGDLPEAERALSAFSRTAVFCPDLIAHDGQRVRDLVKREVDMAFPATQTAGGVPYRMPDLAALPLYG